MARLFGDFYVRDTLTVARDLVGCCLVRELEGEVLACRITETEAYIGAVDKACHAYGGRRTARTETLYAAPGTVYVYLIYGMYHCLNLVTEPEGTASAVLIRGAEPLLGYDRMAKNRWGCAWSEVSLSKKKTLMDGPGKLCRALGITRKENGLPPEDASLYVCDSLPGFPDIRREIPIETTKRVGIDYAEEAIDFPWRFVGRIPPKDRFCR